MLSLAHHARRTALDRSPAWARGLLPDSRVNRACPTVVGVFPTRSVRPCALPEWFRLPLPIATGRVYNQRGEEINRHWTWRYDDHDVGLAVPSIPGAIGAARLVWSVP